MCFHFRHSAPRPFPFGILLSAFLLANTHLYGTTTPLTSTDEILEALQSPSAIGRTFSLDGEIVNYARGYSNEWNVIVRTGKGDFYLKDMSSACLCANETGGPDSYSYLDRVCFWGRIFKGDLPGDEQYLGFLKAKRLSPGRPDNIPDIALYELSNGTNLNRLVRTCGIVRAAERDDSDPNFVHLLLRDGDASAHVLVQITASVPFDAEHYLGAFVRACGLCRNYSNGGLRRYLGHGLSVSGLENINVSTPPPHYGDAAKLDTLSGKTPLQIANSGLVCARGSVIAAWGRDSFLLRDPNGQIVRVILQHAGLPTFGEQVRVLGLPVTDFYNINLIHARWQPTGEPLTRPLEAIDATPSSLLMPYKGEIQLMVKQSGKPLRFSGIVRFLPEREAREQVLQIESNGELIPVDVSANPRFLADLQIGHGVSIAGTCVVNADNWNAESMQNVRERFFLVPRTPADIVIISRPSWWTRGRLLSLLGVFATALLGVIGWNVSLNRRAKAKGKELAAEQLSHVTSELKVNERTRLAVELHDALSQTLTGVSMQIDTAAGIVKEKEPAAKRCLELASRTIDACRMELRNTLWDLRSAALDEPSMDAAIRKTLCQNLAGVDLSVRFNVPRETFSDNTAHAILKIIRELATNALRHGKAASLKIAGAVEGDKLLFSVKDNGCGFDPDLAPGIAQGHFGLQGVAERLERLNGEMTIDSASGKGTKVTVILPIPRSGE